MRKKKAMCVLQERLIVSSDMKLLGLVRDFVLKFIRQSSLPESYENRLVLAVDEAISNIIEHAYGLQPYGYIDIQGNLDEEKLCFIITDSGKSFQVSSVKKPDIMELIRLGKKRGLGIFLMRQIMDEVKYTFKNGQNQLHLVKYLSIPKRNVL